MLEAKILLNAIPAGIIVIDTEGRVIYHNKIAKQYFSQTPLENALSRDLIDIVPEIGEKLGESLKTGKSFLGYGGKIRNKKTNLIFNTSPIRDRRKIVGVISFFQEVSNIEKVINESDRYRQTIKILDAIFKFSFNGLWVTGGDGKVLGISRASEKISEVRASEAIGKNIETLQKEGFFNKSIALEVLRKKTSVMRTQKIKSGKTILSKGKPVFDDKGNIELVVLNDWDITYLNGLREKLKESRSLMETYRRELSKTQLRNLNKDDIVCRSKAMERVIETALIVCKVDSCVLLSGASGVGKSLIAKFIHNRSLRNNKPFICVNCGAIPESLIESELFGYEEGAFTGASKGGKAGIFEIADKGTLFLDEIDTLPLHLQVKLLQFLENKEILRVGGIKHKKIDARVIAATNQNLEDLTKKGGFREDLFFRLSVIPIYIPPLRERREDIPPLINFFLGKCNKKYRKEKFISSQVIDLLCKYSFPGNVRELSNLIERMVVMTENRRIDLKDMPRTRVKFEKAFFILEEKELFSKKAIENLEHFMIEKAMERYKTQVKTAKVLGVDQSTIARKMKKYGIRNNKNAIMHN